MHQDHSGPGRPALYVVATPIGNLGDITLRALAVLRDADVIACEDTRTSAVLLRHHGIEGKRLLAVHEHNERGAGERLAAELAAGQVVALITDAGTPAVSDPGALVVRAVREAGYPVIPIPGPSAALAALSAAGLAPGPFLFQGFLPAKAGARRKALEALVGAPWALVFYEAPHRVRECLADLAAVLGPPRGITVARELTKLHEEIARLDLGDAQVWLDASPHREKGEFVLIVDPAPAPESAAAPGWDALLAALLKELPLSRASRLVTEVTGAPRKEVYRRALELGGGEAAEERD